MYRQGNHSGHDRPKRHYSPQYGQAANHTDTEISQADTSVDYRRNRRYDDDHHRRLESKLNESKDSHRQTNHHSRYDKQHRHKHTKHSKRSRSFEASNQSYQSASRSKKSDVRQEWFRKQSFYRDDRIKAEPKKAKKMTQSQIQRQKGKIMEQIQKLDYQRQYQKLKRKFIRRCQDHLKFGTDFPESTDEIGTLLLKDGLFHQMWSMVVLKNPEYPKEFLQNYYTVFIPMIQKNLTNFENTFNPTPDETIGFQTEQFPWKRNGVVHEETTRSTTKTNVLTLYEQVQAEIKATEVEEIILKKLEDSVSEFRLKIDQNYPQIDDPYNIEWFDTAKAMQKHNANEEHQRREAQIQKIRKFKTRQKSPMSHRFRMMHQVQTNKRRMAVEMACVFLKLNVFYNFSEIHIVKVDEVILSDNQEIIVVKAYSMDFCPLMGKMKLQPKLKNLIGVYKFCNLIELIRLEKTHGNFDGIIVYPECFNVQKYLTTNEELSLLKSQHLEHIRQQINQKSKEKLEESIEEQMQEFSRQY